MEKLIKTLAVLSVGVGAVAVVKRAIDIKNIPVVTLKVELKNRDEYEKILSDIRNFKPVVKQVKD